MNAAAVGDTLDRVLFERFGDIQLFANDGVLQNGTTDEKTARLLQYRQLYQYYSWPGVADEEDNSSRPPTRFHARDAKA